METKDKTRFAVSVKVGPKGQITIPVEARKMFNISEGDILICLGDINRGLAFIKDEDFYQIMEKQNESNKNS